MITIEIEKDIYDYLLKKVQTFNESPSDVLRRELALGGSPTRAQETHELEEVLNSSKVKHARGVVGKFVEILGAVYMQKKGEFDLVLSIRGRGRTYFAKSKKEIEESGNTTQPKQIPGSPYWAMTNSPTSQKQAVLREVLESLGYSAKAVTAAVNAIAA